MATVACKLPNGITIDHADKTLTLNGSNDPGSIGGFGMTRDVDIDWFMDWATGPARESSFIVNDLIFIAGNDANAADQAREQAGQRSGFEGLDPESPAPGVEPTEEQKRELAKAGRDSGR